jgi:diguanylate cyclase (GGDEF)-like protein
MSEIFDALTIYFCTGVTTGVVAVALTYSSVMRGHEKATAWWCAGMWCLTAGLLLMATRAVLPSELAIGIGNALVLLGYGLAYLGCCVFRKSTISPIVGVVGAVIWLTLYFSSPAFQNDMALRVVIASSVIVVYSALSAVEVWRGWKSDRLPSFLSLLVLFITHSVVHVMRAGLNAFFPTAHENTVVSYGLIAIGVENFIHAIGICFFFFAVIKERAERKYRLASEVDSLTGTATRRFFVSETRERLSTKPSNGVLAIIDVDFFKSVNDSFGHLGGDRVLQAFGAFINERQSGGIVAGRLGGEEFGVFLPGLETSQAREWLEDLRVQVEAMQIVFLNNPIRITVSIGAASIRDAGIDFDHLMAAADGALYIAKAEGRNRLRMFNPSMRLHQIQEDGVDMRVGLSAQRLSRGNIRSTVGRP